MSKCLNQKSSAKKSRWITILNLLSPNEEVIAPFRRACLGFQFKLRSQTKIYFVYARHIRSLMPILTEAP